MPDRDLSRLFLALAAGAVLVVAVTWTNRAIAAPKPIEPVFLHRFVEAPSDRPGYRKYVGATTRCVISGTLLGLYDDEKNVPPGAVGAVAIGHQSFYYAKDFALITKPGLSIFYAPTDLKLPLELMK